MPCVQRAPVASASMPQPTELDSLLTGEPKRPWYRQPSPLWLVPFALIAALSRGLTLAPRSYLLTQLACDAIHPDKTLPRLQPILNSSHSLSHINDIATAAGLNCITDPTVQAAAAKLQTILTITMGILSAMTAGWWTQFSVRHGRTRVLAFCTLGLLLTDIIFAIVSMPRSPLNGHGHKFLILAPIMEGLLGGWATLQATTNAYIYDATTADSRTRIFARFSGIFYVGLAVGPSLSGVFLRFTRSHATTSVFVIAVLLSSLNFLFTWLVVPESSNQEESHTKNVDIATPANSVESWNTITSSTANFFSPLATFRPRYTYSRRRKNWSLTFLATAYMGYLLSLGALQFKSLYTQHVFGLDAERLGYYISFMGSIRALHLLIILPTLIRMFKSPAVHVLPTDTANTSSQVLTASALRSGIKFDLFVAKLSLFADFLSQTLVSLLPTASLGYFVTVTSFSCLSGGVNPSVHSLALGILRSLGSQEDVGKVFGGLALLQTIGTTILGPLIFGSIYSATVALYPQTIFLVAALISLFSLLCLTLVRPRTNRRALEEARRGRSRTQKILYH